jgi:Putative metallopeptidase
MSRPIVRFGRRTLPRHVARCSRQSLRVAVYAIALVLALLVTRGSGGGEDDSPIPRSSEATQFSASRPVGSFHFITPTDSSSERLNIGHRRRSRASDSKTYMNVRSLETTLQDLTESLNKELDLTGNINVSFEKCHAPDSFFDDSTNKITVCTEMIDEFYGLFSQSHSRKDTLRKKVNDAIAFFFMHEAGHALVSVLDLPITGREEDAVDQFSVLTLLRTQREGGRMVLAGAESFNLYARWARRTREPRAFWDEHSQDEQRYFDTLCLAYGSDPSAFQHLVSSGMLPGERAEICPDEYAKASRSWGSLLKQFEKNSLKRAN